MKIGTFYSGTIENFNGQCIKSKFFMLGIPLFPVSSFYFVSKDQGMMLPLIGKSARIGLGRIVCPIIGFASTFLFSAYDHFPNSSLKILVGAGAFLFMALTVYSWVTQQSIPEDEKIKRTILGKSIGYNMLPLKLPKAIRINILQSVIKKIDNKYSAFLLNSNDSAVDFENSELPLVYSLATYMVAIKESKPASDFLQKYPAERIYELCFNGKTKA